MRSSRPQTVPPTSSPARSVTPGDIVHESTCTIARHEQFAHPADAAGRNLNSRERGDGRRLEPGPRRRHLLRRGHPEGSFIGELKGALAATVSCVNYGASFALLHFYTVRKDLRGRGYGLRIWNAAIAHAGTRVIGLDGVLAQQQNYPKSGSSSLMPTSGSGLV